MLPWIVVVANLVAVDGALRCPDPAAVRAELGTLAPATREVRRARLRVTGATLHIDLTNAAGELLRTRALAARGSCAELTTAAAVVIASWQSEQSELEETAPAPVPAPRRRWGWRLGLAAVGSRVPGGELVPGAQAEGVVAPWRSVGLRVAGTLTARHREEVAGGSAAWTRVALGVGPVLRLPRALPRVQVEVHAELLAALLAVRGDGFTQGRQAWSFDPGLGAGAKISYPVGDAALFLGSQALLWPRTQRAHVDGDPATADLPNFQVLVVAGLDFGSWR